ncbi:tegument protein VP13/14 [Suid alphaherpesvirus 1]|uniref:Tegument protein UL47 n=1 Tax=Suid herpesvirus 1 TaxID=10345 RepID=A0A0S2MM46_SUHV|nr:tegument protein VP13/14 [Suid alphaherpesvirus 1]ALO75745.1 tegument protein VP13/14 [Suid alphaherpesvirus 1]
MSDAGPVRRPRRSQEQRFQPFPRAGLLVHLQDVLVGEVRRPDFRPPPDEESSEEEEPVWTDDDEEEEGGAEEERMSGGRRGGEEGDDDGDEEEEEEESEGGAWSDGELYVAAEGDAWDAEEDEEDEEEDEEDDYDDGDDGHDGRGAAVPADVDYLSRALRGMETAPGPDEREAFTRYAGTLYRRQFQPGRPGYRPPRPRDPPPPPPPRARPPTTATAAAAHCGPARAADGDDSAPRLERDPDAAYASWTRDMPNGTFLAMPSWVALRREPRGPPGRPVGPPDILRRAPRALTFTPQAASAALVSRDQDAWEALVPLHHLQMHSWGGSAPPSRGGVYATPAPETRGVWRRALRQAIALHHAMFLAPLQSSTVGAPALAGEALAFALDAAARAAVNHDAAARELPERAARALRAVGRRAPAASGPRAGLFRAFCGSLAYWPELRVLSGHPEDVRFAAFHLAVAEVYLLARAHGQNPGFTAEERELLAPMFTLTVLAMHHALRWLTTAVARAVSDIPDDEAFRAVRSRVPASLVPLGSIALSDAEYAVLNATEVAAARDATGLGQAVSLGYAAARSALTGLMRAHAGGSDALVAFALVLQRLAGHANLLLNCLLGAAVHGGRTVRVYEAALDDYAELMDALDPLVRACPLAEFWEQRDAVMRQLRLTAAPGPPVGGKRLVIAPALPSEDLDGLVPPTAVRPAHLGPDVDLAEYAARHPELVGVPEPRAHLSARRPPRGR